MDALAVAVRFGLYLDLTILFGVAAFSLYALRGAERVSGRALPMAATVLATAIVGIAFSLFGMVVLAAAMAGTSITEVDRATLAMLVGGTGIGAAFVIRLAVLLLACAIAFPLRYPRSAGIATGLAVLAAGVAVGSLAWTGHAAAGDGALGWLHLGADIVHLLVGATWIGALAAMLMLVLRSSARITTEHLRLSHRTLAGFSRTGTIVVATLVATGLINTLAIVGLSGLGGLPASLYGRLLIVKLLLFAVMLALAAANRFRLVPRFGSAMIAKDHGAALGALRRSLLIETGCAVAILVLVAWIGTLDPSGG